MSYIANTVCGLGHVHFILMKSIETFVTVFIDVSYIVKKDMWFGTCPQWIGDSEAFMMVFIQ